MDSPRDTSPQAGDTSDTAGTSDTAVTAQVRVVIPCKDEADRIAATVAAVQQIPQVGLVVVVDDGSRDDTAQVARRAGAHVVRHARNAGKAAALTSGLTYLKGLDVKHHDVKHPAVESSATSPAGPVLFVDGDLEGSAAAVAVLIPPVLHQGADMTIAVLPPQRTSGGGHGFVVRLARDGIAKLTGWQATQPLSGMRCLSPAALEAALPLARGWGVEVGLTVDVLGAGLVVEEVPCELQHRVSGSDWRGQLHRAAQYRDVWLALRARQVRGRLQKSTRSSAPRTP